VTAATAACLGRDVSTRARALLFQSFPKIKISSFLADGGESLPLE